MYMSSGSIVPLWITLSDFKILEYLLTYQSLTFFFFFLPTKKTVLYNRLSLTTEMINLGVVWWVGNI